MGAAFGKAVGDKAATRQKARMFFLGAAALSLLMPRAWRANARSANIHGAAASSAGLAKERVSATGPAPHPEPARPPRRMWSLVQLRPEVMVLAISASRAELERELAELNETWNHWELRVERQRYAIQAAPVLFQGAREPNAPVRPPLGSPASEG